VFVSVILEELLSPNLLGQFAFDVSLELTLHLKFPLFGVPFLVDLGLHDALSQVCDSRVPGLVVVLHDFNVVHFFNFSK